MNNLKNNFALYALIIGFLLTFSRTAQAQDVPDNFDPNVNNTVYAIAVQTDGKILIGGFLTTVGGVTINRLARLNTDGTVDTTFNPNPDSIINAIAVQTDGKILIGGNFTTLKPNGGATVTRNRIARLNSNGTVDTTFNPNADNSVNVIAVQTDGKILTSGSFKNLGVTARSGFARLNSNGTVDTAFNPNTSLVNSIAVQTDGKILIGGSFTTVGGVTRKFIARLNVGGTVDTTFINPNINSGVFAIAVQTDGKILIGGYFTTVGGVARQYIARLDDDGTVDTAFVNSNANSGVTSVVVQTDGKILIGGFFTTLNGGAVTRRYIARLDDNGAVDTAFDPNANSTVSSIAVQTDGKILIGGDFTTLNGGTVTRNRIARLTFAPTAAGVTVAGRVRTPNGRGLINAFVILTDMSGSRRFARTTAFGYFRFEDVSAGETYIVEVSSKRYRFASQVLSINQDITDLELTGEDTFGNPR